MTAAEAICHRQIRHRKSVAVLVVAGEKDALGGVFAGRTAMGRKQGLCQRHRLGREEEAGARQNDVIAEEGRAGRRTCGREESYELRSDVIHRLGRFCFDLPPAPWRSRILKRRCLLQRRLRHRDLPFRYFDQWQLRRFVPRSTRETAQSALAGASLWRGRRPARRGRSVGQLLEMGKGVMRRSERLGRFARPRDEIPEELTGVTMRPGDVLLPHLHIAMFSQKLSTGDCFVIHCDQPGPSRSFSVRTRSWPVRTDFTRY
jgi:hypothetical protein